MRGLFASTPSQPWEISAYVVVRASDRNALDAVTDELASLEDIDEAKRTALKEAADEVRDVLISHPAGTVPITPCPA